MLNEGNSVSISSVYPDAIDFFINKFEINASEVGKSRNKMVSNMLNKNNLSIITISVEPHNINSNNKINPVKQAIF